MAQIAIDNTPKKSGFGTILNAALAYFTGGASAAAGAALAGAAQNSGSQAGGLAAGLLGNKFGGGSAPQAPMQDTFANKLSQSYGQPSPYSLDPTKKFDYGTDAMARRFQGSMTR